MALYYSNRSNLPTFCKIVLLLLMTLTEIQSINACRDNHDYFYDGPPEWSDSYKRNCRWIEKFEDRRFRLCQIQEVRDNCPISCGK